MVNWLALDASNYVRSVQSEVRRIFSVFGEFSTIYIYMMKLEATSKHMCTFVHCTVCHSAHLTPPPPPLHCCITVGLRDSALHESFVPTPLRTL